MRGGTAAKQLAVRRISLPQLKIGIPQQVTSFQNNGTSPIQTVLTEQEYNKQVNVKSSQNPNIQTFTKNISVTPKAYQIVKTRKNRKA